MRSLLAVRHKNTPMFGLYSLINRGIRTIIACILVWCRKYLRYKTFFPDSESIDMEWLSSVLDRTVEKCILENVGGGGGWVGLIYKVHVHLKNGVEMNLILKTSKPTFEGRHFVISCGHYREAFFYHSQAAVLLSEMIPKIYYSYGSEILGEYVILMEDVSGNAECMKYAFGNQIWGITKDIQKRVKDFPTPKELLLQSAVQCARLNALFWKDERILMNSSWKASAWYSGTDRESWETAISRGQSSWEHAKINFFKTDSVQINPHLVRIIDMSFSLSTWDKFQLRISDRSTPFTLCHGDFHAGNMFRSVNPSEDVIYLLDWSEFGVWEPAVDLAQMIISDVKPQLFKETSETMVRMYWRTLAENGVNQDEYTFEQCWRSFCRGGAERWIWLFSIIASMELPPECIQYFHDQLYEFLQTFCPEDKYFLLSSVVTVP